MGEMIQAAIAAITLAGGALQLQDAGGAVLAAVTLNSPAGTSAAPDPFVSDMNAAEGVEQ